jgi:hypothetical protein
MSNWIKKGLSVVHITNLEKVMTVEKTVFQSKELKKEDGEIIRVSRLIGIELKLINDEGKIEKSMHHSKELIPLSVAMKGKSEAYKFYNREGEYSSY